MSLAAVLLLDYFCGAGAIDAGDARSDKKCNRVPLLQEISLSYVTKSNTATLLLLGAGAIDAGDEGTEHNPLTAR